MPALLLEFSPGQDVNDIQDEYEVRLYVAMISYFEDPKRIVAFRNDFKNAANDAFILAFIAGKADAGNGDPLTEDETYWINARIGAEIGFADTLWVSMRALHNSDDYTPADGEEFAATHAVNYAAAIGSIYSEGKLFGAKNKFLMFDGDDGAESCQTCQSLKGRRKPARWWLEQELIPAQQGNTNYICGGWQCQHYLVDDDGVTYAGFGALDWAGELAWSGTPIELFIEGVNYMLGLSVSENATN